MSAAEGWPCVVCIERDVPRAGDLCADCLASRDEAVGVPSSDTCNRCGDLGFVVVHSGERLCEACRKEWAMSVSPKDLKPRGVKAPLDLIPARPLRAIASATQAIEAFPHYGIASLHLIPAAALRAAAAAFGDGARKYAPWNWVGQTDDWRETYGAAARRHLDAYTDPAESDYAPDSQIHHLSHLFACVGILLFKEGIDYPATEGGSPPRAWDRVRAPAVAWARLHLEAYTDPNEPDFDPRSGLHRLALVGASTLRLLRHDGIDYPATSEAAGVDPDSPSWCAAAAALVAAAEATVKESES